MYIVIILIYFITFILHTFKFKDCLTILVFVFRCYDDINCMSEHPLLG
jgi:hypothetical protein